MSATLDQIELESRTFSVFSQKIDPSSYPCVLLVLLLLILAHLGYTFVLFLAPPSTQTVARHYPNGIQSDPITFVLSLRNLSRTRSVRLELAIVQRRRSFVAHLSFNRTVLFFRAGSLVAADRGIIRNLPVFFKPSANRSKTVSLIDQRIDESADAMSASVGFLSPMGEVVSFTFSMVTPNPMYIQFLSRLNRGIAVVCVYTGVSLFVISGERRFSLSGLRHFVFCALAFLGFDGRGRIWFDAAFFCLRLSFLGYLCDCWLAPALFLVACEAVNWEREDWLLIVRNAIYAMAACFAIVCRRDGPRNRPETIWYTALLGLSATVSLLISTVYRLGITKEAAEVVERATHWVIGVALAFASMTNPEDRHERRKLWSL